MTSTAPKKGMISNIIVGLTIVFLSLQVIKLGREEINRFKDKHST